LTPPGLRSSGLLGGGDKGSKGRDTSESVLPSPESSERSRLSEGGDAPPTAGWLLWGEEGGEEVEEVDAVEAAVQLGSVLAWGPAETGGL
jgi:hypothetical protein